MTTTIDARGRVTIPVALRRALGMREGDTVVLSAEGGVVRLALAEGALDPGRPVTDECLVACLAQTTSPFDGLAAAAEADHRAGRTVSIRDYAVEKGITLDA